MIDGGTPADFDSVVYYFGTNKGWLIADFDGYALVIGDGDHLDECIISERFADEHEARYFLRHEADFYIREDIPENWKLRESTKAWWDNRLPL